MLVVAIILLVVLLILAWFLTLLALPGNWLMVGVVATYTLFLPRLQLHEGSSATIGWPTVLAIVLLAIVGEALEFLAGALGVAKAGGSKRGAALALVGSMAGALFGMLVGIPIPLVGSLAGALLFAGLGALAGAILGERWKGRDMDESWKVGVGAFWGRILGTLAKTIVGSIILAVAVAALCL